MAIKMVKPDAKGRITLGILAEGVSRFAVIIGKDNKIVLEPYAEIPIREKWLFNNKSAINQVKHGLKDSAEKRVSKRGSFIQYLDEEHK